MNKNNFPKDTSKYKLIVSDFDGTLANSEHKLTKNVVQGIKKWIQKGNYFTIATGRQFTMIKKECHDLDLSTPVIVRGGAEVVDPKNGKTLHEEYMDQEDVEYIYKTLVESEILHVIAEKDNFLYSDTKLQLDFDEVVYKKLSEFVPMQIPKFHVKPIDENDTRCEKIVKDIGLALPKVHVIATHNKKFGKGWDITSVSATKLHGIMHVIEQLNLDRDNVVGVGDSYNDFPLLEAAGLKVAMGNAHQELKEIADVIVPSNEDDGVAYLINNLIGKNLE